MIRGHAFTDYRAVRPHCVLCIEKSDFLVGDRPLDELYALVVQNISNWSRFSVYMILGQLMRCKFPCLNASGAVRLRDGDIR